MTISYSAFKKRYPVGSSIGKPFHPYDYIGECVSFTLRKMVEVDGVPLSAPLGHAAQIPYNATFKKYYKQVPASERQAGDLMFWGDDPGNWTGFAGHTAIYDGGDNMYNQNYNSSRKVSVNKIFTPGFIGYFRLKKVEEEDMTTQEAHDVGTAVYRVVYGREPENSTAAKNMGWSLADKNGDLTPKSVIAGLQGQRKAKEWKERQARAKSKPGSAESELEKEVKQFKDAFKALMD